MNKFWMSTLQKRVLTVWCHHFSVDFIIVFQYGGRRRRPVRRSRGSYVCNASNILILLSMKTDN
jgi:hypothetical protein